VGGGLGILLCIVGVAGIGLLAVNGNLFNRLASIGRPTKTVAATDRPTGTRTARPPATLSPTGESSPAPTLPAGEILFRDDFSDVTSGWDRTSTSDGGTDYADGAYRISVDKPQADLWANPGLTFTDVRVEVDATKAGGPDNNDFGVICRYRNSDNFYAFWISSDGFVGIVRYLRGEFQVLGDPNGEMKRSSAVEQGQATNHIAAECIGSTLRLIVNGTLVDELEDSSHPDGDVGLMAGTFNLPGAEIVFDNFVVLRP
jgi:hypothetical protein